LGGSTKIFQLGWYRAEIVVICSGERRYFISFEIYTASTANGDHRLGRIWVGFDGMRFNE
jgi:hypothetical protein